MVGAFRQGMKFPPGLKTRIAIFDALQAIERGLESEEALAKSCDKYDLDRLDRTLAWAIVMSLLRNRIFIDAVIDYVSDNPRIDAIVRQILRIGIAQVYFMDKIPAHAIVSTSVEMAKGLGKSNSAGFINAVLRKISRKEISENEIFARSKNELSVKYSHPAWLVDRWNERFGREFSESLIASNNREPPFYIRTNLRKISTENFMDILKKSNFKGTQQEKFPEYIKLEGSRNPSEIPGFAEGYFSVQDPAFSIPIDLLSPLEGEKILEIGCAPGGKISHLAERFGGSIEINGLDISAKRLKLVSQNLIRLGLSSFVRIHCSDARVFESDTLFDAVLIDAPCTALGIIRRHPEIRYKRTIADIEKMSELQSELIVAGLRLLKPGGRLVYCACSTEREEGEDHLGDLPNWAKNATPSDYKIPSLNGVIRTWQNTDDLDCMVCFSIFTER